VAIIGLNSVTSYAIMQLHANVDSILVLTSLDEEEIETYGVAMLEYLYLTALGMRKDNVTIVKPSILKTLPKIQILKTDLEQVKVKHQEDRTLIETGKHMFESTFTVISYEAIPPSKAPRTLIDVDFIRRMLDKYGALKVGEYVDLFKLAELYINFQEQEYECIISDEDKKAVMSLLQELHIDVKPVQRSSTRNFTDMPDLLLRIPIVEPKLVEHSQQVLDLRYSRYNMSELFLLSLLIDNILRGEVPSYSRLRLKLILSKYYTCYSVGLLKFEVSHQIRECSTTRSTLYLPECTVTCRVVYRGAITLGFSVTTHGPPDARCVGDYIFRTLMMLLYRCNLAIPFIPSTLFSEVKLCPDVLCLRNMLRELKVEKLFKLRAQQPV